MSVSTDAVDPCNDDLVRAKLTMFNLTILMSWAQLLEEWLALTSV